MSPLLDQLLLPQRLLTRALDDLHHMAEAAATVASLARQLPPRMGSVERWMDVTAETLRSLRDEAAGVRASLEPIRHDVTILRDEFGRANDEIARLREAFGPELAGLRESAHGLYEDISAMRELLASLDHDVREFGDRVTSEMQALQGTVGALTREAGEISEVVEPLQAATERVGRVAERLPGSRRRR